MLKDASSAAIYGAKAASGVIIISTKKGKVGKPVINLTANFGANTKAQYRDVFSPSEYMKYREDWFKATTYGYGEDGKWGYYGKDSKIPVGYYDHYNTVSDKDSWAKNGPKTLGDGESLEALYARRMGLDGDASLLGQNYLAGKTYDWNDAVFQTGFIQDYNASISGATDNLNYYMSFGYLNKEGAIQGDEYKAYRASMKINAKITNWLEMGANVNFQDRNDVSSAVPLGGNYWDNNQLRQSPYSLRFDENGKSQRQNDKRQPGVSRLVRRPRRYCYGRQILDFPYILSSVRRADIHGCLLIASKSFPVMAISLRLRQSPASTTSLYTLSMASNASSFSSLVRGG